MNWANSECKRRHGKDSRKTDPEAMRDVLGEALSLIRDSMEFSRETRWLLNFIWSWFENQI